MVLAQITKCVLLSSRFQCKRYFLTEARRNVYHICIVGSGPAGFFTAQYLLKYQPLLKIDIFERRPCPFGNLRYGIAPDHEGAKNATQLFMKIANNKSKVRYYGNVEIGKDVNIAQLTDAYHAVVLCHGCSSDRALNIPGEYSPNVFSAREFVHWYNGEEDYSQLNPCLDVEEAVVIGHGNVALDVTRILLKSVDELRKTDISTYALEKLAKSRIRKVHLVGRGGPNDVTFTCKELRELLNLPGARLVMDKNTLDSLDPVKNIKELKAAALSGSRTVNLLRQASKQISCEDRFRSHLTDANRQWQIHFHLIPTSIWHKEGDKRINGVYMKYSDQKKTEKKQEQLNTFPHHVFLSSGMLIKSIGYKTVPIEDGIPFDKNRCIYPNNQGKIYGTSGLYCSGWVKTGPVGPPVTLMQSFLTAECILSDIKSGVISFIGNKKGSIVVEEILKQKGVSVVDLEGWNRIDTEEIFRGRRIGKPREKIIAKHEMMKIAEPLIL